jgi:hypothetical protein
MDLIYTNAKGVDQGVLNTFAFDLSYGASENDFELTVGMNEGVLDFGATIYMDGTEYGGIVDTMRTTSNNESITYYGRTWHGVLNSKVIQPDEGEDYYIVSGDANDILHMLIERLGLTAIFATPGQPAGHHVSYQFHRYCLAYDGIRDMLADNDLKLHMEWVDRTVLLSAVPVIDYTENPIDGDTAVLTVKRCQNKINHLICLGRGELAQREVIHLYVDQFGRIGKVQHYTGSTEYAAVYDNTTVESFAELETEGRKRLKELRNNDTAEISMANNEAYVYDIGDIIGATDVHTGVSVATALTQKIVKINNNGVSVEYKTGCDV